MVIKFFYSHNIVNLKRNKNPSINYQNKGEYEQCSFSGYEFKLNSLKKKANKCYFAGYASVFSHVDRQNDVILPGAFAASIKKKKQYILLWQHNHSEPIGKITHIHEDAHGLYIKGELILEIRKAMDVYYMLKNDILNSFSIGYNVIDWSFDHSPESHEEVRIIKNLQLWEISLVTFPANTYARLTNFDGVNHIDSINLKPEDQHINNVEELHKYVFDQDESAIDNILTQEQIASQLEDTLKILKSI